MKLRWLLEKGLLILEKEENFLENKYRRMKKGKLFMKKEARDMKKEKNFFEKGKKILKKGKNTQEKLFPAAALALRCRILTKNEKYARKTRLKLKFFTKKLCRVKNPYYFCTKFYR